MNKNNYNLNWKKFSKINNHLYDLNGVKPVISISRSYPFKENFTHVLGYVSQANQDDIEKVEVINILGAKVLTTNSNIIITSDLAKGTYIVNIKFKDGRQVDNKLIVE